MKLRASLIDRAGAVQWRVSIPSTEIGPTKQYRAYNRSGKGAAECVKSSNVQFPWINHIESVNARRWHRRNKDSTTIVIEGTPVRSDYRPDTATSFHHLSDALNDSVLDAASCGEMAWAAGVRRRGALPSLKLSLPIVNEVYGGWD